jgi:hypothetical protein
MELKHSDLFLPNTDICLADLCPVIGCSYSIGDDSSAKKRSERDMKRAFSNVEPCSILDAESRKNKCLEILDRYKRGQFSSISFPLRRLIKIYSTTVALLVQ